MQFGEPIHLEAYGANASPAVIPFVLYKAGSKTAFTLKSTQYITITDIIFSSTAGGTFAVAFETLASVVPTAGTRIAVGEASVAGGLAHHFETPMEGMKGVTPSLFADAGQVDCVMTGYVNET
jgi:hypothetical protein